MSEQQIINCLGLVLDIAGVIGLFKYGLPNDLNKEGHTAMAYDSVDQNEIDKWKKYNIRSMVSLVLIVFGFFFQLLSTLWTVIPFVPKFGS